MYGSTLKDPKINLCICEEILNVISNAGGIGRTSRGTLSVNDSQNLLFFITDMLQFYSTANVTMQMLTDSRKHSAKPKITSTDLANHRCRIWTNCIIAVMRKNILPNQKSGHFNVPKKLLGHRDISFESGKVPEETGRMRNLFPGIKLPVCESIILSFVC